MLQAPEVSGEAPTENLPGVLVNLAQGEWNRGAMMDLAKMRHYAEVQLQQHRPENPDVVCRCHACEMARFILGDVTELESRMRGLEK